jgi:MYXO-CTERM domain-containing protein
MRKCALIFSLVLVTSWPASSVHSNHHAWDFSEVFSNWDGSVQFIEFTIPNFNHPSMNGRTLQATSIVAGVPTVKTFTYPSNLPTGTNNKKHLIASPGFGSLAGGITPDYELPAALMPFFLPNADSISLKVVSTSTTDAALTFTGAQLPNDGETSLTDSNPAGAQNLQPTANSPTNFAGAVGHVDLPVPEPASAGLAALAAVALAAAARRRR